MKLVKSEKPCKNVENIDKSENSETIEMSKSVKGKTKMLPWGRSVESSTTPRQKWHMILEKRSRGRYKKSNLPRWSDMKASSNSDILSGRRMLMTTCIDSGF